MPASGMKARGMARQHGCSLQGKWTLGLAVLLLLCGCIPISAGQEIHSEGRDGSSQGATANCPGESCAADPSMAPQQSADGENGGEENADGSSGRFTSARAADEDFLARKLSENQKELQQKLVLSQQRRRSAFLFNTQAKGSVADSWGGFQRQDRDKSAHGVREPVEGAAGEEGRAPPSSTDQGAGEHMEGMAAAGEGGGQARTATEDGIVLQRQEVDRFLQEHREYLSNLRLNLTGSREKAANIKLEMAVTVPESLGPGDRFLVRLESGQEYTITVPDNVRGGQSINLVIESGVAADESNWHFQLQSAVGVDKNLRVLEVSEAMLNFFYVPEAQTLAMQAMGHLHEKASNEQGNRTQREQAMSELATAMVDARMVSMIAMSVRLHSAAEHDKLVVHAAHVFANLLNKHTSMVKQAVEAKVVPLMLDLVHTFREHQVRWCFKP
jgi:hypothetical protein